MVIVVARRPTQVLRIPGVWCPSKVCEQEKGQGETPISPIFTGGPDIKRKDWLKGQLA